MMPRCELFIELADAPNRAPRHYQPGDEVRGILRVKVYEDCRCKLLRVELAWRTHGFGNSDTEVVMSHDLGPFDWTAGSAPEVEFTCAMPDGPVSYRGHTINVDWYLTATADIAWGDDAATEIDLLLQPTPADKRDRGPYRGVESIQAKPHEIGETGTSSIAIPIVFALFVLVVFAINGVAVVRGTHDGGNLFWLIFSGVVLAILAVAVVHKLLARRAVGDVTVEFEPAWATRGQRVVMTLTLRPRRLLTIQRVDGELLGQETTVVGHGTKKRRHEHELFRQPFVLIGRAQAVGSDKPVILRQEFTLPADAPHTFHGDSNHVVWTVAFRVDILKWPDYADTQELIVYPS